MSALGGQRKLDRTHTNGRSVTRGELKSIGRKPAAPYRLHDLSGIHYAIRIERVLDRTHRLDSGLAILALEEVLFALADPVLSGAGSFHRQGSFRDPVDE